MLKELAATWDSMDPELREYEVLDANKGAERHASDIGLIIDCATDFVQEEDEEEC